MIGHLRVTESNLLFFSSQINSLTLRIPIIRECRRGLMPWLKGFLIQGLRMTGGKFTHFLHFTRQNILTLAQSELQAGDWTQTLRLGPIRCAPLRDCESMSLLWDA